MSDALTQTITEGIFSGLDYMTLIIMGIIMLVTFSAVVLFLIYVKSFKHKIRIKEVVNGRKIVIDDFFKEIKSKDGTIWYKLFKTGTKIPRLPPEAIEINSKGKKVVEVYRLETGEYIPVADKNSAIPQDIMSIEDSETRKKKIEEYVKNNKGVIYSKEPLTTEQRIVLVNECIEANSKVTKSLTEVILQLGPMVLLCLVIVAAFAFWGELGKPVVELSHDRTAQLQIQKETVEMIRDLKNDVQVLQSETKSNGKDKQEAPN